MSACAVRDRRSLAVLAGDLWAQRWEDERRGISDGKGMPHTAYLGKSDDGGFISSLDAVDKMCALREDLAHCAAHQLMWFGS